jgi:hypothetical protein
MEREKKSQRLIEQGSDYTGKAAEVSSSSSSFFIILEENF